MSGQCSRLSIGRNSQAIGVRYSQNAPLHRYSKNFVKAPVSPRSEGLAKVQIVSLFVEVGIFQSYFILL